MTTFKKWATRRVILVGITVLLAENAFPQESDKKRFEDAVYSIVSLSHFGIDNERFTRLSPSQKRNVIACRDVLVSFLRAVQEGTDARQFVSSEFTGQFTRPGSLGAAIISPESSLMAAGITEFKLDGETQIELRIFALVFAEGKVVVNESRISFKQEGALWRIYNIEMNR